LRRGDLAVHLLNWLFGKKDKAAVQQPQPAPAEQPHRVAARQDRREDPLAPAEKPASTTAAQQAAQRDGIARPGAPEQENLQRWQESGQPRAWVEAHGGRWNHEDWLGLLEELKKSSFWPMQPDAVGLALEKARQTWVQRN
jgi:hypothetical protein